ncbi:hypothetical protein ACKWTF_001019 [Chironomus riparius]
MNSDWNQIKNEHLFITQQVFAFRDYAFYFRILKNTIDSLIDTGQMEYLLRNYYPNSQRFDNFYNGTKVLALYDLQSGFLIWFGCCGLSIFVFIIEHQYSNLRNTDFIFLAKIFISYFGKLYHNYQEPLDRINQDQSEKVDYNESDDISYDELEEVDHKEPIENVILIQEIDKNNQDQEIQKTKDNDDTNTEEEDEEGEESKMEVVVEVHQASEIEESLEYFENIILSNEKQQRVNDPEAISNFMDIELFGEVLINQEIIE